MTISTQTRTAGPFTTNGSTTAFPFAFKCFAASDIVVVRRVTATGVESNLVLNTDYTVSLNANQDANPGGTVNTVGALGAGFTLTLTTNLQYLQPTDLTNQGGFYPKVITTALDRLTIFCQQVFGLANRALKFPISDGNLDATVPGKDQRKGRVLAFHETTGLPVAGPTIADTGTVAGSITAIKTVADNIADVQVVADYADEVANFNATYQGPKTNDPTTRNDGSPLQEGDLYFNTNTDRLRVYTGSRWAEGNSGSVSVQRFTGDGTTVSYQLNAAPDNENVVQVFIGGVYQSKTEYDITGTNADILTFTAAPPNGAPIEAVTFSVLPLGVVDANQVQMPGGGTLDGLSLRFAGFVVDVEYPTLQEAIDTLKPVKLTKVHDLTGVVTVKNILFADDNAYGFLKKSNSGLIDLSTTGAELYNLTVDGNGLIYTGGGVLIAGGTDQQVKRCKVINTYSNPIVYSGVASGLRSNIEDCDIYAQDRTNVYGVKYPDTETYGDRTLRNIRCQGGLLADFNGCATILVQGCNSVGARFTGLSKKVSLVGNRWAGGSLGYNLTLRGDDHIVSGDIIATDLILDTDAQGCTVVATVGGNIVDNSTNKKSNKVYGQKSTSIAQWLSTGTLPAIGAGSLVSSISREGNQVTVTIVLTTAPSTTYGTGSWFFRLPYNAAERVCGTILINNGGSYGTQSVCVLNKGSNDLYCYEHGAGNAWNSGMPFTWNGDESVTLSITYQIG